MSIDLPWKLEKPGRRAVAIADIGGHVTVKRAENDNELLGLIHDNGEEGSYVLLDIPIEGCDSRVHFRPVENALQHLGISLYPSSQAEGNGKKLKERMLEECQGRELIVKEVYPYAVYKFLAYLKKGELLNQLKDGHFKVLLNNDFRKPMQISCKRGSKTERINYMQYLYSLLTSPALKLKFSPSLRPPTQLGTIRDLNELSDEYDACLGAIASLLYARNNRYACVAGDADKGEILLLADGWLQEQFRKEINVRNLN